MTIDPLASDNIDSRRARHQGPGIVRLEGIKFGLHGSWPIRISQSRPKRRWKLGEVHRVEVEAIHRLNEAGLGRVHMPCAFEIGTTTYGAVAGVRPGARLAPLATVCDKVSIGAAVWGKPIESLEAPLATTWDGEFAGAAALD